MVMKILLLLAASFSLISADLTAYHGRVTFDSSSGRPPGVVSEQVQGVVTLALGGTASQSVAQYLDCNSTGSNLISNLVWKKDNEMPRFDVHDRGNSKRLDLSSPTSVTVQDEGIYTCMDVVTMESLSLNVTGGSLAICPAKPIYNIILGSSVSLMVYVAGFPPVKGSEIQWYDPSNERILPAVSSQRTLVDTNRTLLIQNVGVGHSGMYRIDLRRNFFANQYLNVTSTLELNVLIAPMVESNPIDMMVVEHDDVTFTCVLSGYPEPDITWEREGNIPVPVSARTTQTDTSIINSTAKTFTVSSMYTIHGIFVEDEGRYGCSSHNNFFPDKEMTTFAQLSVTPRLQLRATINTHSTSIPESRLFAVQDASRVSIECRGSGTLFWTSSTGAAIPLITTTSEPPNNVFQRSDTTSNEQTLFIKSFGSGDRDVYTCGTTVGNREIREDVLITSSSTDIYISEPIIYAVPGNNINISATIVSSGQTIPSITWFFNGTQIDTLSDPYYTASLEGSNAVLSITAVREYMLGYYMVTIRVGETNQSDTAHLIYPDPPTSSVDPVTISANEGETVQFRCVVGGTDPVSQWSLEESQLLPPTVIETGTDIQILSVSRSDAGRYVCEVTNRFGGLASSTATLNVLYPPMATVTDHGTGKMSLNQRLEVTMQEGDPAFTFSCSSDGFPIPTLTWTGPGSGGGFPSGVGVVQNRLNSQQTLVWNRNLVYTDSGSYVCAAQNSKNTSTVTLTLLVERSPTVTSIYPTSPVSSLSNSFVVPLGYVGNILTCSGFGWPPPEIEWVRGNQSLTGGRVSATGQNRAFVSAKLKLGGGVKFEESHAGNYSCIVWAGDGTNQSHVKVITLTSSNLEVTQPPKPECTIESPQTNFQIRVLNTECNSWVKGLKEHIAGEFQNEILNVISTECQSCAATADSVTISDVPTCSTDLQGAAVFRGSINTSRSERTEEIFCTLDTWYRTGPLLLINNKLHLVDQDCTLMLDTNTLAECTIPPVTMATPVNIFPEYIIYAAAGSGALAITVVLCVLVMGIFYSIKRRKNYRLSKRRTNSDYERTLHMDRSRYTTQITPEDLHASTTDSPVPLYSTLDTSMMENSLPPPPTFRTNSDLATQEFEMSSFRKNSSSRLLSADSTNGGRMFQLVQDIEVPEQDIGIPVPYEEAVSSTENLDKVGITMLPDGRAGMSSSASGTSSSQHTSSVFMDHTPPMDVAGRRTFSSTNQIAVTGPNGQIADYEQVDPRYNTKQYPHASSSPRLLTGRVMSAGVVRGPHPGDPGPVRRHKSALMEGELLSNCGTYEEEDYSQLNRNVPGPTSMRVGGGVDVGVGSIRTSDSNMWGRGGRGRGQFSSTLPMSSFTSSSSSSAATMAGASASGSRPATRQSSLPEKRASVTSYSRRPADDPRTSVSSIRNVPLSPTEEAPPSYRDVILSDSSMMENDAYQTSAETMRHVQVQHQLVKSPDATDMEEGGEAVDQYWYRSNSSDLSLDSNTRPREQRPTTRLSLAPYSQVSNSEIDARKVEQPRHGRLSMDSRVFSRPLAEPTPYAQPVSSMEDLTRVDGSKRSFGNMVLV